jgi:hypothetical protein
MTTGEQMFEGMDRTTRFKFVGVKYESLKTDFAIDEEVEFRVRGTVKGSGDERMNAGLIHLVKIEVDSVVPLSFDEPEDPAVKVADDDGLFDDEAAERDRDEDGAAG